MGSIAGIFDEARENLRRGKASIGRSVDIHRGFNDRFDTINERLDDRMTSANDWTEDSLSPSVHQEHGSANVVVVEIDVWDAGGWNVNETKQPGGEANDIGAWPNPFD